MVRVAPLTVNVVEPKHDEDTEGVQVPPEQAELVPARPKNAPVSLFIRGFGVNATGDEAPGGFVVRAGSEAQPNTGFSFTPRDATLRHRLIDKGVLTDAGNRLVFVEDYLFNSPSAAAVAVLGYSANGRIEWKDAEGRTLKEIQADSATGTDS